MKFLNWKIPQQVLTETQLAFLRGQHEVFAIWTAARQDAEQGG